MSSQSKSQSKAIAGIDENFRIEDLDHLIYETFNNDLAKRMDFIAKILDW